MDSGGRRISAYVLFWAVGAGEPRDFNFEQGLVWAPMFALSRPDGLPIGFCHAVTVLDSIAGALLGVIPAWSPCLCSR